MGHALLTAHALDLLAPWARAAEHFTGLTALRMVPLPTSLHATISPPWSARVAAHLGDPAVVLSIDHRFASALLGRPIDALCEAERGLLELIAACAFEQVERAPAPLPLPSITLGAYSERGIGTLSISLSGNARRDWMKMGIRPELLRERTCHLVEWTIELGSILLSRRQLEAFSAFAICIPQQPWTVTTESPSLYPVFVRAHHSPHRLSCRLLAQDGQWRLETPEQAAASAHPLEESTMSSPRQAADDPQLTITEATHAMSPLERALAEAPLELRFVLARKTVDAAAFAAWSRGDVIELDVPLDHPIRIELGRHLLGFGELVKVNEQLGIRVSQLCDDVDDR
jgi:flagellar motor switch/type III secretory pathway protein FliN